MSVLLAQCIALLYCFPYQKMSEAYRSNDKITIPVARGHGICVSVFCQL